MAKSQRTSWRTLILPGAQILVILCSQVVVPCLCQSSSSEDLGRWSEWSSWSPCSSQCGPGISTRSRRCMAGSSRCGDLNSQTKACVIQACPTDKPTAHEAACAVYNSRVFSGRRYIWEPFTHPPSPCKLACRAKGAHFYANLAGQVEDGTPCGRGTAQAVCVSGACKRIGCDDVVASSATRDACGVCRGDGSSCSTISGIFTSTKLRRGLNDVISIPAGSTNINITELEPSRNLLLLQTVEGRTILNGGSRSAVSGDVSGAGTVFTYSAKTRAFSRQRISAPGPINVGVKLKLLFRGRNPGIMYNFNVPRNDSEAFIKQINQHSQPVRFAAKDEHLRNSMGVSSLEAGRENSFHREQEKDSPSSGNPVIEDLANGGRKEFQPSHKANASVTVENSARDNDSGKTLESGSNDQNESVVAEGSDGGENVDSLGSENFDSDDSEDVDSDDSEDFDSDDSEDFDSDESEEFDSEDRDTLSSSIEGQSSEEGDSGELEPSSDSESSEEEEGGSVEDLDAEYQGGKDEEESVEIIGATNESVENEEKKKVSENEVEEEEADDEDQEIGVDEEEGKEELEEETKKAGEDEDEEEDEENEVEEDDNDDGEEKEEEEKENKNKNSINRSNVLRDGSSASEPNEDYIRPKYSQSFSFGERYKNAHSTSSSRPDTRQRPRPQSTARGELRRPGQVVSFGLQYVDGNSENHVSQAKVVTIGDPRNTPNKRRSQYLQPTTSVRRNGNGGSGRGTNQGENRRVYIGRSQTPSQQHQPRGAQQPRRAAYGGGYGNNRSGSRSNREREYLRRQRIREMEMERRQQRLERERERYQQRLREYQERLRQRQAEIAARRARDREAAAARRRAERDRLHRARSQRQNQATGTHSGATNNVAGRGGLENPRYKNTRTQPDTYVSKPDRRVVRPYGEDGLYASNENSEVSDAQTREENGSGKKRKEKSQHRQIVNQIKNKEPATQRSIISRVAGAAQQTHPDILPRVAGAAQQTNPDVLPRVAGVAQQTNSDILPRVAGAAQQTNPDILPRVAEAAQQTNPDILPRVAGAGQQLNPDILPRAGDTAQQPNLDILPRVSGPIQQPQTDIIPRIQSPGYLNSSGRSRPVIISALSGGDAPAQAPTEFTNAIPDSGSSAHQSHSIGSGLPSAVANPINPDVSAGSGSYAWRVSGLTECTVTCGGGVQQTVVVCVDTTTQAVVTDENCRFVSKPDLTAVKCNTRPCPAEWIPGPWSACSATCGRGERTRGVYCLARVSPTLNLTMDNSTCEGKTQPAVVEECELQACSSWRAGEWSQCSAHCGEGERTRLVECVSPTGEVLTPSACTGIRPQSEEDCDNGPCGKGWFYQEWPEECPVECGAGEMTRKIFCWGESNEVLPHERCDPAQRPETSKTCRSPRPCGGVWFTGPWSKCDVRCGRGKRTRGVLCIKSLAGNIHATVGEENCLAAEKPAESEACQNSECGSEWYMTSWSQCSKTCGTGYKSRDLKCLSPEQTPSDQCPLGDRPETRDTCNTQRCKAVISNETNEPASPGACVDSYSMCRVAKNSRLCRYQFYKVRCCKSCSEG